MFDEEKVAGLPGGVIPAGLDSMEPGPVLGAMLAGIDVASLSGYDQIVVLRAQQRMVSHHQAAMYRTVASIVDTVTESDREDDAMLAAESAAAEIRAALRLTRRSADHEVLLALTLRGRLAKAHTKLTAGELDVRRIRVLDDATAHLSDEAADALLAKVIDDAHRFTTGQLAAHLKKLTIDVDPEAAKQRYDHSHTHRRIVTEPTSSGTVDLVACDLAPHIVASITRRINHIAHQLNVTGETRTIDQLRADVFTDLLQGHTTTTGRSVSGPRGVVDIHVDLVTLAELTDTPGDLAGYGPVIADIARQVADTQHDTEWRYTITHPDSGAPIATGTTRRRPTAAQRRIVEARHPVCIFPGCRMPATACDLDHRIPWTNGGPTTTDHLTPLCRHDHVTRHRTGWQYQPLPNGDHHWTSPLGHTYTTSGQPP